MSSVRLADHVHNIVNTLIKKQLLNKQCYRIFVTYDTARRC